MALAGISCGVGGREGCRSGLVDRRMLEGVGERWAVVA